MEIGVCEGDSLSWVLENLRPDIAWGIDPYIAPRPRQQGIYDEYLATALRRLAPWLAQSRVRLIQRRSFDYLRDEHAALGDESVGLAYVDGGHFSWDVVQDACLLWPKLRRGGVIIFDDLQRVFNLGKPLVRLGVWPFLHAYDTRWEPFFWEGRQLAVRKTR